MSVDPVRKMERNMTLLGTIVNQAMKMLLIQNTAASQTKYGGSILLKYVKVTVTKFVNSLYIYIFLLHFILNKLLSFLVH